MELGLALESLSSFKSLTLQYTFFDLKLNLIVSPLLSHKIPRNVRKVLKFKLNARIAAVILLPVLRLLNDLSGVLLLLSLNHH